MDLIQDLTYSGQSNRTVLRKSVFISKIQDELNLTCKVCVPQPFSAAVAHEHNLEFFVATSDLVVITPDSYHCPNGLLMAAHCPYARARKEGRKEGRPGVIYSMKSAN